MIQNLKSLRIQDFLKTDSVKIALGVFLLALSAQIQIPLHPVPITLHTVAVMVIGLTYAPHQSLITVLSYAVLGAAGWPFFAGYGAGLTKILGPTGGYIIGFIPAAYVMSVLYQKLNQSKWISAFVTCLVGSLFIYSFGIAWLSTFVGFQKAVIVGLVPFILPGLVKIGILSSAMKYLKR